MKVLITGGAGFIGSELVRQCLSKSHQVTVVDNLINGKKENLDGLDSKNYSLNVLDIRNQDAVRSLIQGSDIVYHLACLGVRHSIHAPSENHSVNATATLDLLKMCRDASVPRFVYVSTSEVYGTAKTVPMTEEHPTLPHTVYGGAKLAGECYTRAYYDTYKYPTTVIRPFNSFGPRSHHEGDSGEVIPKFILKALTNQPLVIFGDGTQTRDFTFVEDTARGIMEIGLSDRSVGETFNLGSCAEISISDLAKLVKEILPQSKSEIIHEAPRPGDVRRLYADSTKAHKTIGFAPKVAMRDGLMQLIEWYKKQPQTPEELLKSEKTFNWK